MSIILPCLETASSAWDAALSGFAIGGGTLLVASGLRGPAQQKARSHAQASGDTAEDDHRRVARYLDRSLAATARDKHKVMLCWVGLDRGTDGAAVDDVVWARLTAAALARITRSVRNGDAVLPLREGTFCVIQTLQCDVAAPGLARRLLSELSEPYLLDDMEFTAGVRIGVALSPQHGMSAEILMGSAQAAFGLARLSDQRRLCIFDDAMNDETRTKYSLIDDLRSAIENHELILHYQPLCDGKTLRVCGHEALLRWTHPTRGPIEPACFIPLAEQSGLIHQLGQWVLETACRAAASWPDQQYVAVNLSPAQLRKEDFAQMVADVLRRTGLPPTRLELEVTESVLMDDTDHVAATFRSLRETGVKLALDDFGTGYSSLSYLRRLPFDRVKIDRSFVHGLGKDDGADAIVRLIVGLGQGLGMQVTAEGVETEAQLRTLQEHCCSHVQGFLLGRPAARRPTAVRTNGRPWCDAAVAA